MGLAVQETYGRGAPPQCRAVAVEGADPAPTQLRAAGVARQPQGGPGRRHTWRRLPPGVAASVPTVGGGAARSRALAQPPQAQAQAPRSLPVCAEPEVTAAPEPRALLWPWAPACEVTSEREGCLVLHGHPS